MDWECVLTLTEYFTIYCIAISSNSEILASAGYGKISIWHLPSRQRLHSLIAHIAISQTLIQSICTDHLYF